MPDSERVQAALDRLVRDGTLTERQADRVLTELCEASPAPQETVDTATRPPLRLAEAAAYLGGALLLAAAAVLFRSTWEALSSLTKFSLAVVVAAALLAAAWWTARGAAQDRRPSRRRLAATLAALSALAAGCAGIFAVGSDWQSLSFGLTTMAVSLPLYLRLRGAPLLAVAWLGGLAATTWVFDELERDLPTAGVWSLGLAAYGACWLAVTAMRVVAETGVTGTAGGLTAMAGAEVAAASRDWAGIGLLLAVVLIAALLGMYAAGRGTGVLAAGVVTTMVVPPTALGTLLDSWQAAAGALFILGALSLAAGIAFVRRRVAETPPG